MPEDPAASHVADSKDLDRLLLLFNHLPLQLSEKHDGSSMFAGFLDFSLNQEHVEDFGSESAALSKYLKDVFGWDARSQGDGILPILERGSPLSAMHGVLFSFWKKDSSNAVLGKWVHDLISGAEKAYRTHGVSLPKAQTQSTKRGRSESDSVIEVWPVKAPKFAAKANPGATSTRGRQRAKLPHQIVTAGVDENGKDCWKCNSCSEVHPGNVDKQRVFKHALRKCPTMNKTHPHLYSQVADEMSGSALGAKVENSNTNTVTQVQPSQAVTKPIDHSGLSAHVLSDGKLNLEPLRRAGAEQKALEKDKLTDKVNHVIMRLICVRGLPPAILDSLEWKELVSLLNGIYKLTLSDEFRNRIIPCEAAFVRREQIQLLKQEDNLTLSFDGTTIRKKESFYTAHATTSDRRSYFLDGHEGKGVSHNTEWITEKLLKTIDSIGRDHWAASVSDNTNVTKAARRETSTAVETLLDLCDCVHHMQNTIKDITKDPEFKTFITLMKGIIKYFSKSSLGSDQLRQERNVNGTDEPVKALQKISTTRFGGHWMGATALEPCLPAIRKLAEKKILKLKNTHVKSMLLSRDKYNDFDHHQLLYINIIAPLIRSLWSLEAAHANASDVFVFWLAAAASLDTLFANDEVIPRGLADRVTNIFNTRYAEFFGKNDIYFVAFLLDPRYSRDDFLVKATSATDPSSATAASAYGILFRYLREMLRPMLKQIENSPNDPLAGHPLLRQKGIEASFHDFKSQLETFWGNGYPFRVADPSAVHDPLLYWKERAKHELADVVGLLAVRTFSILVNSMPDERTNSAITWLNSPYRGNQHTSTIVDMIQVGQWWGKHQGPTKPVRYRPAVKFRAIDKKTLNRLQNLSPAEAEIQNAKKTKAKARKGGGSDSEDSSDSDTDNDDLDDLPPVSDLAGLTENGRLLFKVNPFINLKSKHLLNMVSAEPVITEPLPRVSQTPNATIVPPRPSLTVDQLLDG